MGQLVDKSNRIRQEKGLIMSGIHTADTGLQCSKQHILFHDRFIRQFAELLYHTVQNCRLSRIGISYQSHLRDTGLLPLFPLHLSGTSHIFQFLFQFCDTMIDLTPVQFQLFLTGALITHAATGTALSAQCIIHSYQSRQHILQSGCLHL